MVTDLFAGTSSFSWYVPPRMTMTEPDCARAIAAPKLRSGEPFVPAAALFPLVET
jgi:hypothetical protein